MNNEGGNSKCSCLRRPNPWNMPRRVSERWECSEAYLRTWLGELVCPILEVIALELMLYVGKRDFPKASEKDFSKITSFGDLGFTVCGPIGRFAVDIMIVLAQAGFCLGLNSIPTLTHLAPLSIFADVVDLGAMGVVMVEDVMVFLKNRPALEAFGGFSVFFYGLGVAVYALKELFYEVVERRFCDSRYSIWLRWVVVLGVSLVALLVPNFADFLSLVGSSVCCLLGFVLPSLFHLLVFKEELGWNGLLLDGAFVVFGVIIAVTGTWSSLLEIFASKSS
ncbi:amino acid transporter AVT3C [Populus alba x Populus x berolinensis]|uniref:Amino acid transporter AVT3C n=1 Tax=Populus alba x Populus x berolinensis TaxID=444605 RepID=A0AAD6QS03_9ROSI|nr:amino acid transporter AVT3C [Populus alba x Populus x berolinensis]